MTLLPNAVLSHKITTTVSREVDIEVKKEEEQRLRNLQATEPIVRELIYFSTMHDTLLCQLVNSFTLAPFFDPQGQKFFSLQNTLFLLEFFRRRPLILATQTSLMETVMQTSVTAVPALVRKRRGQWDPQWVPLLEEIPAGTLIIGRRRMHD